MEAEVGLGGITLPKRHEQNEYLYNYKVNNEPELLSEMPPASLPRHHHLQIMSTSNCLDVIWTFMSETVSTEMNKLCSYPAS